MLIEKENTYYLATYSGYFSICEIGHVTAAHFVDLCAADKAVCEWNAVQHLDSSKYPL